jgi:hypothetical protein
MILDCGCFCVLLVSRLSMVVGLCVLDRLCVGLTSGDILIWGILTKLNLVCWWSSYVYWGIVHCGWLNGWVDFRPVSACVCRSVMCWFGLGFDEFNFLGCFSGYVYWVECLVVCGDDLFSYGYVGCESLFYVLKSGNECWSLIG